jgi:hypothetical protein
MNFPKNRFQKLKKEIKELYYILIEGYFVIKKLNIKKENNLILFLFHECMYFFSTKIYNEYCQKDASKINLLLSNKKIEFGERNSKSVFNLKKSNKKKLKILHFINKILLCFSKKKIILGVSVYLNIYEKILLFLYAFLFRYKINFVKKQKLPITKFEIQKKIFLDIINKINKKFRLKLKKKEINKVLFFLKNNFYSKKDKHSLHEKQNIYLIGSVGNILNRLNANIGLQNKSRVIIFGHGNKTGITSQEMWRYGDLSYCTDYVGFASKKQFNKFEDVNYCNIDRIKPNYYKKISFTKRTRKQIYFNGKDIKNLKGLYISKKFQYGHFLNLNWVLDYKYYLKWQNFLMNQISTLDYKIHPKQKDINFTEFRKLLEFNDQRIQTNNLEKIINSYDYFVFDFISSKAFADIASCNKPIIYFDIGIDKILKQHKNLLNQRAIRTKLDIYSSLHKKKFHKSINFGQKKISLDYISKFIL